MCVLQEKVMARQGTSSRNKSTTRRPMRLCLVGTDLLGADPNTESAAAIAAIAQKFAATGDELTFLWVPPPERIDKVKPSEVDKLRQKLFETSLINLVLLPQSKELLDRGGRGALSIAVYHYLREEQFDAVFFSLEGGMAYYALLAKETGVYPNPPPLHVIAQSPTAWLAEADKYFLYNVQQVTAAHMERYSVETCDALVCSSQAVVDWMRQKGWSIPAKVDVIPPLVPYEWRLPETEKNEQVQAIHEIVFCSG